jgi:hypothetical protein
MGGVQKAKLENINNGVVKEGYLWKIGKKSGMMTKRYYVLKESALICFTDKNSTMPHGKSIAITST